ncbi:ParB/RepB/Spo0J family partition protein [Streptantibioticus silvisoli]|uniref:Transcriptional regulator n=1 Tax=Streptantibioticus silvisoli TaxID=2705255 RepID=A0ABT6VV53_9ACTN|nr:ParB N-terminal domain-containing protein [Streptantibioticus silvisoli]MDI5962356.1 transcriptional regulator [Streptantibioticus silvisoli]
MSQDDGVTIDGGADFLRRIASHLQEIHTSPVRLLAIGSLTWDDSPRVSGLDDNHVRLLANLESPLPPITVHAPTLAVIDGAHRVRAALLQGRERIPAYVFGGSQDEAFLLSVSVNTTNGLPLSVVDRVSAARRILTAHPAWSDRAVATVAGMSASAVAALRRRATPAGDRPAVRIGRDGRLRPVDRAIGRERASEFIRANPTATLRQVAAAAGISPATVADVRDRLRRGVDPVPRGRRAGECRMDRSAPAMSRAHEGPDGEGRSLAGLTETLLRLRRDPALRFNDTGREVLRLLSICTATAQRRQRILTTVPAHCLGPLAELMHGYADVLRQFGEELEQANGNPTAIPRR